MGCSSSCTTVFPRTIVHARTSMLVWSMSQQEKHVVRQTWQRMNWDRLRMGMKIFLKVFDLNPSVKEVFPNPDMTEEDLLQDPFFKDHSARFMQVIGEAVDHIDDFESTMAGLWMSLGKKHVYFYGFKKDYFDTFKEAAMNVWSTNLRERFEPDVEDAWRQMFDYMVAKLKEGYAIELNVLKNSTMKIT